jgi:hypothetical protein
VPAPCRLRSRRAGRVRGVVATGTSLAAHGGPETTIRRLPRWPGQITPRNPNAARLLALVEGEDVRAQRRATTAQAGCGIVQACPPVAVGAELSDLAWPGHWDQGGWGTALGVAGLIASVVAAILAGGARRAARAQRSAIGRARLVAMLQSVEVLAIGVASASDQDSEPYLQGVLQRWPRVAGEIRGLLEDPHHGISVGHKEEITKSLSGVSTQASLSREALKETPTPTVSAATRRLRGTLDRLVELTAELQVTIEQGAAPDAN